MVDGKVTRDALPMAEKFGAGCALGCSVGECTAVEGIPSWALKAVSLWRACGGKTRTAWPRAGGLEEQDAAVVWWFSVLDEEA